MKTVALIVSIVCACPATATVRDQQAIPRDSLLRLVPNATSLGPARRYRVNGIECTADLYAAGESPGEVMQAVAAESRRLGFRKTGRETFFEAIGTYAISYAMTGRGLSLVVCARLSARTVVAVARVGCGDLATLRRADRVPPSVPDAGVPGRRLWTIECEDGGAMDVYESPAGPDAALAACEGSLAIAGFRKPVSWIREAGGDDAGSWLEDRAGRRILVRAEPQRAGSLISVVRLSSARP